jgi:hypothetical protein
MNHFYDANMLLVGRVVARGWEAEQCRPEALAVRGIASMPEAPSERGGIATNVMQLTEGGEFNHKI